MKYAICVLTLCVGLVAQDLPLAPKVAVKSNMAQEGVSIKTFSWENIFAASGIAADAWSTQRVLSLKRGYEQDPLAAPFVKTRIGQASISSLGMTGVILGEHILKRHKVLSRVFPVVVGVTEWYFAASNIAVYRRNSKPIIIIATAR